MKRNTCEQVVSPNSTWLVTSRLDTTRHVRRVLPVELVVSSVSSRAVRQARQSQNAWARHLERVESCRDVTWRAKWNLSFSWIAASWWRLLLTGKVDFVQTNAWWTLTAALTANAKWSRISRIRSASASANLVGSATNAKKVYAVSAHPMLQYRGCAW